MTKQCQRLVGFIATLVLASYSYAQSEADSVLRTTWYGKGSILQDLAIYFGDNGILHYETISGIHTKGKWTQTGNQIYFEVNNKYVEHQGLIRGNDMGGEDWNVKGKRGTWTAIRQKSNRAVLVAGNLPVGEPLLFVPWVGVEAFDGSFETKIRETLDGKTSFKKIQVRCKASSGCTLNIDGFPTEIFDKVIPLRGQEFAQARFALLYAKDHANAAVPLNPSLSPLLSSNADIQYCQDLAHTARSVPGATIPGYQIVCKVSPNPWNKPAVIFMGTDLANCGTAFCRYGLIPLFEASSDK
ncbi:MAG: hypothetical protein Q7J42_16455 [Sulfuritalea sp.]|nr:hypothetical protein [Sulfuritalea sp.]